MTESVKALVGNVICAAVLLGVSLVTIGLLPFVLIPKIFERR